MAVVQSDQYNLLVGTTEYPGGNTTGAHTPLTASAQGGKVRVAYATYTFASSAEGTEVNLFTIPQGARLISGTLVHEDLGTSVELDIGYKAVTAAGATTADPDKFLDGTDVSSAGKVSFLADEALGFGNVVGGSATIDTNIDTDSYGLVVTATTVDADGTNTTTGKITVIMEYAVA